MSKFICVTDAVTETEMIINAELIAKVEEAEYHTSSRIKSVRKIKFVDNHSDEYVTDSMNKLIAFLCS